MHINKKIGSSKQRLKKTQRLKEKICQFPDCGVKFIGRGKAKYCEEHRKPKYRKDLYKLNDNTGEGILRIDHDEVYAKEVIKECSLEGCNKEYKLIVVPRLFEYPSMCEEHRNPYKRERFLKERGLDTD